MEVVASKRGSYQQKRTWEEVVATFTSRRLVSLWRRQSYLWSILKGFHKSLNKTAGSFPVTGLVLSRILIAKERAEVSWKFTRSNVPMGKSTHLALLKSILFDFGPR